MTILEDFLGEYRKMLPDVIIFHYGSSSFSPIGDKVVETAIGSKHSEMVAIKLWPIYPNVLQSLLSLWKMTA